MPFIDLSILNQRQTPAFYADVLANRPSAGFVGRIFISTNTFAFFRDNGTSWDLIGGPGTGTVTGSGAAGQVSFWNGASSITGNNDLFWDSVNGHLGIGTNVPGTALQIDHDQNQFIRLNQTTATNDTKIAFQNSGIALWRIGNSYNAGANDFGIFDVIGSIQPVTVKKTTGQVLIGTSTVGSGKLVVASATSDNHIQIVGAAAPSLRIDSAESGPTKRIGIGLATAVNNFIQNSQNLDMCIFNGSTSAAGNMLFGIYDTALANVQEAARISAARNFLIGTITDTGQKLQVSGTALITGAATFSSSINGTSASFSSNLVLNAANNQVRSGNELRFYRSDNAIYTQLYDGGSANGFVLDNTNGNGFNFQSAGTSQFRIANTGAATISTTSTNGLTIQTNDVSTIKFTNTGGVTKFWGFATTNLAASDFGIYQGNSNGSDPITAGTARLYFGQTGNVLIGTTTDTGDKLQVAGTITNYRNYTENTTNGVTQNAIRANAVNNQGAFTWLTYGRGIVATGTGTKLNIPFTSQTNINLVTIARVTICSADFNSAFGGTTQFTFSVGSLNSLSNLIILQSGGNYVSATTSGMNVVITQGGYTAAYIYIEYLTPFPAYSIDLGNITLTS
jgi:hypothetical protein